LFLREDAACANRAGRAACKYPPAKPESLTCEPLKAAERPLSRPTPAAHPPYTLGVSSLWLDLSLRAAGVGSESARGP
jgi:hypothetical protein